MISDKGIATCLSGLVVQPHRTDFKIGFGLGFRKIPAHEAGPAEIPLAGDDPFRAVEQSDQLKDVAFPGFGRPLHFGGRLSAQRIQTFGLDLLAYGFICAPLPLSFFEL